MGLTYDVVCGINRRLLKISDVRFEALELSLLGGSVKLSCKGNDSIQWRLVVCT